MKLSYMKLITLSEKDNKMKKRGKGLSNSALSKCEFRQNPIKISTLSFFSQSNSQNLGKRKKIYIYPEGRLST